MIRRTSADWLSLFNEQEQSGQSAKAFCQERGVNVNYFKKRRKELVNSDAVSRPSAFVPMTVARGTDSPSIELKLSGVVLTLPISLSPAWLAELVQHLGS